MNIEKKNIIKAIKEYFCNKTEVTYAYVFGSFISSKNYHDVDIAISLEEDFNKNDNKKYPYGYESKIISELEQLLRTKVDIVIMNNAGITILKRIINSGELIIERHKNQRIAYENYIRKLYIDASAVRKIKRKYLSKKINHA